jgi:hypothetical protein
MGLRLRFWLHATDAAFALDRRAKRLRHLTARLYLWTVAKASDATDWGEWSPDADEEVH